ncbi:hypothetical protein V493_04156 [Pseudogymnoascus sp. VKM F-4281 (FW-2241)]|nr:hypothetical protein V493_04156 [Pseudogymnoascus sp. VKM F-4281 (FW-2241)]
MENATDLAASQGPKPADMSANTRSPSHSGSDTSDIDLNEDEGWEDAEPQEEQDQIVSLFDDKVFTDVPSMLLYCKEKFGFDFLEVRNKFSLDFYGTIKLVNYIRTVVRDGQTTLPDVARADFEDDKFMMPVLQDDALLFNLDDLPPASKQSDEPAADDRNLLVRVAELEEELRKTQFQFEDYRSVVKKTLTDRWNDNSTDQSAAVAEPPAERDDDSHYFTSYSYNDIHETMLKDTVRTDAYRDFIYQHKHLFKGKVVLDVGCGTGILSLFCAKAGAARVIAVDNSDIIDKARENIFNNGFADTITCLRGKVEEVTLPVEKVDIIVSEWMGYCLLYEAMLDSVIWARDKYLKPDGLMVPSHMNMWVAPVSDADYVADHFSFWRDVYGFDMKAMMAGIREDAQVLQMPGNTICGDAFPFIQLSLHTTTVKDLVFTRPWKTTFTKDIDRLDGFDIWFDTFFMPSGGDVVPVDARAEDWTKQEQKGVAFTTGPFGKETHWRQGVMFIDHEEGKSSSSSFAAGDTLEGSLEYAVPEDNSRALDVKFSWASGPGKEMTAQTWKMR